MKLKRASKTVKFKLIISTIIIFILMTFASNFIINARLKNMFHEFQDVLYKTKIENVKRYELIIIDDMSIKTSAEFKFFSFIVIIVTLLIGALLFYMVIANLMKPLTRLTEYINGIDLNNTNGLSYSRDKKNEVNEFSSNIEIETLYLAFNEVFEKLVYEYERQKHFSANVAHELRTPLTIQQSKIELFKENNNFTKEDVEEFICNMEKNTQRLTMMIDKILFLSKPFKLNFQNVNVKSLIEEIFFDLEDSAYEKNINMSVEGELSIKTDDELLQRVLYNLIENSIKYNYINGTIEAELYSENDKKIIKIKDTGIGISDEDKSKIFNLFYRVDKSRSRKTGGYGIGLSLVATIIEKLDASIKVENNLNNEGTIFVIEFN